MPAPSAPTPLAGSWISENTPKLGKPSNGCTRATRHYPKEGNRYFAGLEAIIDGLSEKYDLPHPNNIEMHISDDGQSWYAVRQTITGHWFSIGAAGPPHRPMVLRRPHRADWLSQRNRDGIKWVPDSNSLNWAETPEAQLGGTTEVHETGNLSDSEPVVGEDSELRSDT